MTIQPTSTFAGDALNRREFAEGIYKLLQRLHKGVVAIDGDWGVGKTWFGLELKKLIENKGEFHAIWIDAFEADWTDDPALTLISLLASELPEAERKTFFDTVTPLVTRAIPSAAKLVIKAAANFAGVDDDVADGVADIFKDSSESFVRKKLEELADREKTLEYLKASISTCVVKSKGGKVVVFVDELDRCSPAYAIRMLERLKHLFEIDGVIFVLLWHRQQIKNAVEVFYGAGSDGAMYLDKFVDYPLSLSVSNVRANDPPMQKLLSEMMKEFPQDQQLQFQENISWLTTVSFLLRLNARQTQRLAKWWVMSKTRNFVALETWLIGIKAKFPDVYEGLRGGEKLAHESAANLLAHIEAKHTGYRTAQIFLRYHQSYASNVFDDKDEELNKFCAAYGVLISESLHVALRHIESTLD
jgi:hypothetical protein